MQLLPTGREFSQNLLAFQRVRKEHDRIWTQKAFGSEEQREQVSALVAESVDWLDEDG